MIRRLPLRGLEAIACALWLSGCTAKANHSQATGGAHASGIRLSPNPASTASQISVVLEDPRLNSGAWRFEWCRNGDVITGVTTRSLDPSKFSRGDNIAVAAMAPASSGRSMVTLRARVRVANTPPRVTLATLVMNATAGGAQLEANVECVDPDGDRPTYAYQWFKNGGLIGGAAGASLPATILARGDRVAVEVVASDGEGKSAALRSEAFTVDNRPPQFTSRPSAPRPGDEAFHYRAVASDPDGDPLRYELVSGPAGMSVDPQGSVTWPLPSPQSRLVDYAVRIRAIDSKGGEAVQDFTIHLDGQKTKS